MPNPIILIDSASGSDSLASGAGPSTALTGTAASTSGTGLVVTLDGSPNLAGVATDGSHVLYLADATAGARNFGKITASANSGSPTAQVTVSNAFGLSLTGKAWAIGGKRAALGSTTTGKLFNNNNAAGDAMPGWVIELVNAHTETIASGGGPEGNGRVWFKRNGDTTSGPITLRGESGAATRPKLTFANAGTHGIYVGTNTILRDFDLLNSNATKNEPAIGIPLASVQVIGVTMGSAANPWSKGIVLSAGSAVIERCDIGYCKNVGIEITAGNGGIFVDGCSIHDQASGATAGILISVGLLSITVVRTCITTNSGPGILMTAIRAVADATLVFSALTVQGNTGDGIVISANDVGLQGVHVINSILSNNGGYGLNFSHAASTDIYLASIGTHVRNNNTYNNTSGAYKSATGVSAYNACPWALGDPGANPTYASGSDFTPTNPALKGASVPIGYPTSGGVAWIGAIPGPDGSGGSTGTPPRIIQSNTWSLIG